MNPNELDLFLVEAQNGKPIHPRQTIVLRAFLKTRTKQFADQCLNILFEQRNTFDFPTFKQIVHAQEIADYGNEEIPWHLDTCKCRGSGWKNEPPKIVNSVLYEQVSRCDQGPRITRTEWDRHKNNNQIENVTPEFVNHRAAALKAFLNGEPDAIAWLKETGLRPEPECECPFCQTRMPIRKGNLTL